MRGRQLGRLVVDGHDDLDVHGKPAGVHVGLVGGQGCHAPHGADRASGLDEPRLWTGCESSRRLSGGPDGLAVGHGRSRIRSVQVRTVGMRTVTAMPSPGAELAVTVPPCASTMAATIESPRPLPPLVRVRAGSDR